MEWTGTDGRGGPRSCGTNSTTTPGTGSTSYTFTPSSPLSWMSMEAAIQFLEIEMEMKDLKFVKSPKDLAREKKMKQIKILAKEFFGAPSSAKFSIEGADLSVLKRWFTELGVGWVLHVVDGAPAREFKHALDASSWIPALIEIVDVFRHGCGEEEETTTESEEQLHLARFTQRAMLKMLTFVDFIVAPNLIREVFIADEVPVPAPFQKLHTLLHVRKALSMALSEIWLQFQFDSSSFVEVGRIHDEVINVLSAKEDKVCGAIWSALEEVRTRILESPEDSQGSSGTQTPHGSSDIDKATMSVMMYVMFMENYDSIMAPIVSEAASVGKYIPQVRAVQPLTSLAVEIVSWLEVKLANKSEAFPDQGLRFLFLLNNTVYIKDELYCALNFPESYKVNLVDKVEGYMERYIQVSWAPVLSCLVNPTPSCLGKNYSPLPKFESEFQKVYIAQKLWKVPNPELRNKLRRAIIDKIIPGYSWYLADYDRNAPPKFSPLNLQEMLQELFEG